MSRRIKASHALGKLLPYFPVDMTQLGVKGTSALAPFPGASAASGSGEIDAVIASHHGGQVHPHPEVKDVEDWSETSSDRGGAHDMPSIKAHGTKIALPQAISYKAATARHAVP